jgi:hypothetical protein
MIVINLDSKNVTVSERAISRKEVYSILKKMWYDNRMLIPYHFPLRGHGGQFLLTPDFQLPAIFETVGGWTIDWPKHLEFN